MPGINGSTSTRVQTINNNGSIIRYAYDANGNIKTITRGTQQITYTYNEANEVVREDNQVLNKTIVYAYDVGGNIASKTEYPYTTGAVGTATRVIPYVYSASGWRDRMISYDGKSLVYDVVGNPISYNGYSYRWESGHQLAGITGNGRAISYKYNDGGIRTQKTVDGVTTQYVLEGDKVVYETSGTDKIHYTYSRKGSLLSMNLNGIEYYYIKNAQGAIMGLYDKNGAVVVEYAYDTWGNLLSTTGTLKDTVGLKNLYRYRGYRYDTETGFYYLNSRYYNPEWGRFLNADAVVTPNMYAYAGNNPVNMIDSDGFIAHSLYDGGGASLDFEGMGNSAGSAVLDTVQTVLDIAGLAPGFGEGADLVNAAIYAARGDYVNAGLSAAAAIPIAGWAATSGKLAGKGAKAIGVADDVLKGAGNALKIPANIDNAGKFVSWTRQFEKAKTPLSEVQVNELIAQAKRFGVKVEATANDLAGHTGKAGENWGIPHIHIGDARVHIPVPNGYKLD